MALRVLLADESSTIKKVIQLALQDFGVDVKSVAVGLDVVPVVRSFRPDIVLTDILLAKRNGYEVCEDLKKDPELRNIPVILMWSGFMEIDEGKARAAKPDRRLEKPFDAETLRKLVRELVPGTQSNVISSYLSFPKLPEILPETDQQFSQQKVVTKAVIVDFDEPEEFQQVPLPKNRPPSAPLSPIQTDHDEAWVHQDLNRFQVKLPSNEEQLVEPNLEENDLSKTSIALSDGLEEIALADLDRPNLAKRISGRISERISEQKMQANPLYVDTTRAEEILREEARSVLKEVAWQLLPGICERVVREELEKLLKEVERL